MYGLMDGWIDGWTDRWMDAWMDGWVDGWMGGWVDGWMGGWVDGCVSIYIYTFGLFGFWLAFGLGFDWLLLGFRWLLRVLDVLRLGFFSASGLGIGWPKVPDRPTPIIKDHYKRVAYRCFVSFTAPSTPKKPRLNPNRPP